MTTPIEKYTSACKALEAITERERAAERARDAAEEAIEELERGLRDEVLARERGGKHDVPAVKKKLSTARETLLEAEMVVEAVAQLKREASQRVAFAKTALHALAVDRIKELAREQVDEVLAAARALGSAQGRWLALAQLAHDLSGREVIPFSGACFVSHDGALDAALAAGGVCSDFTPAASLARLSISDVLDVPALSLDADDLDEEEQGQPSAAP